jgi:inner membrane protein
MLKIDSYKALGSGIGWKIISIIIIVLILTIALFSLQNLIRDRINYKMQVLSNIGLQWGEPKTILGPVLRIPYNQVNKLIDDTGKVSLNYQERFIYLLPETINASVNLDNKELYRGIYKENVYKADIDLEGRFNIDQALIRELADKNPNLNLDKATLIFAINEIKSFKDKLVISIDNHNDLDFDQSTQKGNFFELSTSRGIDINKISSFRMRFKVNGSRKIELIPAAKEFNLLMKSNWPHPSFTGAYAPETRSISDKGFEAKWKIVSILDNYENLSTNSFISVNNDVYNEYPNTNLNAANFGVQLYSPVNIYTKTEKSLKYGFIFILLTFSIFFLIEVLFKQPFHQMQYLLVGLAVSIFYLLLLSFSEHMGFDLAYLIAASAIVTLIWFYSVSVFAKKLFAQVSVVLIAVLYAYLYLLLQLSDYSLLFGSIGLFAVLTAVMLVSRKINWYEL